eukprot:2418284-Alexandrium_andersonii.AAC.1
MSASLVGSEMCIRDRARPARSVAASALLAATVRATLVRATTCSARCLLAAARCQSIATWLSASMAQQRAASASGKIAGSPPA